MEKECWKPGNMVYPIPAVMVSCSEEGKRDNIITIAWTGTICTNPPMVYISVRPSRYSYDMIKNSGEFVINLTTENLVKETDYCGVRSGRDVDKFEEMKLHKEKAKYVSVPLIKECPVNIECKVTEIKELGSHHMFMAEVLGVNIDPAYLDESGRFNLNQSRLMIYSHGEYYGLGNLLGTFGYSVQKKKNSVATKTKKKSGVKKAGKILDKSKEKSEQKGKKMEPKKAIENSHKKIGFLGEKKGSDSIVKGKARKRKKDKG